MLCLKRCYISPFNVIVFLWKCTWLNHSLHLFSNPILSLECKWSEGHSIMFPAHTCTRTPTHIDSADLIITWFLSHSHFLIGECLGTSLYLHQRDPQYPCLSVIFPLPCHFPYRASAPHNVWEKVEQCSWKNKMGNYKSTDCYCLSEHNPWNLSRASPLAIRLVMRCGPSLIACCFHHSASSLSVLRILHWSFLHSLTVHLTHRQ